MSAPIQIPGVPIAPRRFPVVGHLPWIMFDLFRFLRRCRERGPVFWLHDWVGSWSVVIDGESALDVLKNKAASAEERGANLQYILEHTLLILDGDEHRRVRGTMNRPFSHAGLTSGDAGRTVAEVLDARLASWAARGEIELLAATGDITLDVIFRLMGVPTTELPQWRAKYRAFVLGALPGPGGIPGTPRWRALRARGWLDQRASGFLGDVRAQGTTDTLLGALAHGTDEDGRRLSEPELLANLRVLGLAGHETTASTLAWAMLLMGTQPQTWDRLVEEATSMDDPPVTPADLSSFPYAEAVFRESLRLYPPASLIRRKLIAPLAVHDVELPAGLTVSAPLFLLSRDPSRYPDPDAFVPQRWLDRERRPGPAESFQFGAGAHFCLGYHLAVLEGVQFLVRVARCLADAKLRPRADAVPSPSFFPVVRPPAGSKIQLVAA